MRADLLVPVERVDITIGWVGLLAVLVFGVLVAGLIFLIRRYNLWSDGKKTDTIISFVTMIFIVGILLSAFANTVSKDRTARAVTNAYNVSPDVRSTHLPSRNQKSILTDITMGEGAKEYSMVVIENIDNQIKLYPVVRD